MARQHRELSSHLDDADTVRTYASKVMEKQEELELALVCAQIKAGEWEEKAKENAAMAAVIEQERDATCVEAWTAIEATTTATAAQAQSEETKAYAKEARVQADEAKAWLEANHNELL